TEVFQYQNDAKDRFEMMPETQAYCQDFLKQGYCIVKLGHREKLEKVRKALVRTLRSAVTGGENLDDEAYLNQFHKFAPQANLNELRVKAHKEVGGNEEYRKLVFECVEEFLHGLIGNELVMQRNLNFVMQVPRDPTGLLYLHTDAWSGCSPY